MERLTRRHPDGSVGISQFRYYNYDDCQKMMQKLADYEDAEEHGLLLRLPCKPGTWVYEVKDDCEFPGDCYRKRMCNGCEDRFIHIEEKILVSPYNIIFDMNQFGKTLFLTKAEAEKALAEMD